MDIRKSLDQDQFGQVIANTLKITPPHIKDNILDFILYCLNFGKFFDPISF